jgi:hypothetical protein
MKAMAKRGYKSGFDTVCTGGIVIFNEDLLAALRELLEATSVIASGELATAAQVERYKHAREWAQRLLDRQGR